MSNVCWCGLWQIVGCGTLDAGRWIWTLLRFACFSADTRDVTTTWTIFLDRDGVLNRRNGDSYVRCWDEFEWLPGAPDAVRMLNRAGALTILVTNQRGVALGQMSSEDVERIHDRMRGDLASHGARLDGIYVCPHDADTCECRKPKPGLLIQAKRDFPTIDFGRAFLVGDSPTDMAAGNRVGCRTIGISSNTQRGGWGTGGTVAATLLDAVQTQILPELRRQSITSELTNLSHLITSVAARYSTQIEGFVDLYRSVLDRGGKLCFAGNGGSAADAQHVAAEYVVRYQRERRALPAIALTTDTSLLTACGNDHSFDEVFARQVEALCGPRDLLVVHSTSGESPNLVRAVEAARRVGCGVAALLGKNGGTLRGMVDHAIVVPSDSTPHIQTMHMAIEHIICGLVELEYEQPALAPALVGSV
jgi:D-sedoheptulose 7-phosphate isomerase